MIQYLDNNHKVFVDITAEWCINCKINKKLVLQDNEVQDLFKKSGIKFAPIDLAAKFSMEHPETNKEFGVDDKNVFGFHGKHLQKYFKDRFIKKRDLINGK